VVTIALLDETPARPRPASRTIGFCREHTFQGSYDSIWTDRKLHDPVEVDVESDNHQPVRANGEGGPSHQRVSGTRAKPGTAGRSVSRASIS